MKKILCTIFSALSLFTLHAEDTSLLDMVAFQYAIAETSRDSACLPASWGVIATGDFIGNAKVSSPEEGANRIKFNDVEVDLLWAHKFNRHDGITLTIGYENTQMEWEGNPLFEQTEYPTADIGFLAFTDRIDRWFWQVGLAGHFDTSHNKSLMQSSRYLNFLWGRYTICASTGFHIGTILMTGIRKTNVVPILGFDYTYCKWKLNAIFPVNIGVTYCFSERWSATAMGVPVFMRRRLPDSELLPQGIWQYTNYAIRLGVNYRWNCLLCSLYGGVAAGGTLKVMNQKGDDPIYNSIKSSPYAGFNFMFVF